MRLVVVSDLHLDASTSGLERFDEIAAAARAAADDAIRFAEKGGSALFVFAGDLCDPDTTRSFRAIASAVDLALTLSARGVPSLWIAGNHDVIENARGSTVLEPLASAVYGRLTSKALPYLRGECARVAEEPTSILVGHDLLIAVLPYVARARMYDPIAFINRIPPWDGRVVVIGHLTVPSAERGSESDDFARGREMVFPVEACRKRWGEGVPMINGHYHRRQVTRDGVVIPGSLARLRHDEEQNEPGYLVIDL